MKENRELAFWLIAPWVFVGGSYVLNLGIASLADWMVR